MVDEAQAGTALQALTTTYWWAGLGCALLACGLVAAQLRNRFAAARTPLSGDTIKTAVGLGLAAASLLTCSTWVMASSVGAASDLTWWYRGATLGAAVLVATLYLLGMLIADWRRERRCRALYEDVSGPQHALPTDRATRQPQRP